MPRIRTVKPEFFRSPSTARASFAARILFEAMWCWADDFGIGETNVNGLLGFAFCDDDGIDAAELQRLLTEVQCAYEVVFYSHHGRFYYAVPTWDAHQKNERRAKRRLPTPDDPDSARDLRFYTSDDSHGISVSTRGHSGTGTGEQGNRGTGEQGNPSHVPALPHQRTRKASRAEIRMAELNATSRTAAADNFAAQFAAWAGGIPRGTLIEIAQETDQLIADGIDAHQIADGIKAWHASDRLYPSQIPHFVAKAAKPNAPPKSTKATQRAIDTAAITAELIAEFHQEPA